MFRDESAHDNPPCHVRSGNNQMITLFRSKALQDNLYKTTIAIAGMIQAVSLVKDLAQTGKTDEAGFKAAIQSIFITDPDDFLTVYGGLSGVKIGLETLVAAFSPGAKNNRSLMRYVMSLIHLEKKIRRSATIQAALKKRIEQAKKQAEYFHSTHPSVIANLADCYLNTISTFRFRIIIWGNPALLNSVDMMEKIRALLLAGIRSAVLWRQASGSRLQLLFGRAKIKAMAEKILVEISHLQHNEKETL